MIERHRRIGAVGDLRRYEWLAEDFRFVERGIGLSAIELPRLQVAREPTSYPAFYTPESLRIVAERYRRDLELFGHVFDAA